MAATELSDAGPHAPRGRAATSAALSPACRLDPGARVSFNGHHIPAPRGRDGLPRHDGIPTGEG